MAETEVRQCIDWLEQKKAELEGAGFGGSHYTVTDAGQRHASSRAQIMEYRKQMDKLAKKQTLTDAELQAMYGSYQVLETIADKKSGCLEMIKGIASLEGLIQGLSTEFDSRTVHLVNVLQNNKHGNGGKKLDNATLVKATQSCMSAVRQSWRWMDEVMQCAQVHLANASAYHQFFHDVEETDYFMNSTLSNMHLTFRRQNMNGDRTDLNKINTEIKDTLMAYLRWQSKVDNLVARSRDVVPVHRRTHPCKEPQIVVALASYKTDELEIEEGETLTLLDNTDKSSWKVKNGRDQTGRVPAVIILIGGATGEALDAAVRMRLQLLGLWTTSVKRLGIQMIAFMQLVFRDWSDDEVRAIQQMSKPDRQELQRILTSVEGTLDAQWRGFEGFEDLQENMARLRTILEEADSKKPAAAAKDGDGKNTAEEVVVQVKMLENLMNSYQGFWTYWETYKMATEMCRQPKYILVCDKWDQLRFTSSAHYVRFWDTTLMMPKDGSGKRYKAEAALTIHETPMDKRTGNNKPGGDQIKPVKATGVESGPVSDMMDKSNIDRHGNIKFPSDFVKVDESSQGYSIRTGGGGDDSDDDWKYDSSSKNWKWSSERGGGEGDGINEEMNKSNIDRKSDIKLPGEEVIQCSESSQSFAMSTTTGGGGGDGDDDEWVTSSDVTEMTQTRETTMDEVQTSMEEVQTVFIIKKVFHPETQEKMTLEEAVRAGIIDQAEGKFNNIVTGESYTFQEAMANGDIMVEMKSQKTVKREKSSYGLVTIKTFKETRPYSIKAVLEHKTERELTVEEAEKKGIVNINKGQYFTESGEILSIIDAIQSGLIHATFHGKADDSTEVSKTYAVSAIVDQRRKMKVPFADAMKQRLFDTSDGMYVNNVTYDRVPFTDAVIKGFIKARVITDTSSLDIDPSNRIVVERMASAQQKIIKAVRAAKAFQAGAKHMNGK